MQRFWHHGYFNADQQHTQPAHASLHSFATSRQSLVYTPSTPPPLHRLLPRPAIARQHQAVTACRLVPHPSSHRHPAPLTLRHSHSSISPQSIPLPLAPPLLPCRTEQVTSQMTCVALVGNCGFLTNYKICYISDDLRRRAVNRFKST